MIEITLQELNNPWSGSYPIQEILNLVDQNPFSKFQEMDFDATLEWIPYDSKKAHLKLRSGQKASVAFRTKIPYTLRGSISKDPLQNTVRFIIHENYLKDRGVEPVLDIMKQLAKCFPKFHWGVANADVDINEFYSSKDLPRVPICFMYFVSWFHLISPIAFEKYFDREDLLNIPAYEVLEWENGIVQIMTFKDPLAFNTEENRKRIIEITNYLNKRRKDWKQ